MSGGSMLHLYLKVLDAARIDSDEGEGGFPKNTDLRKRFAAHLVDVAVALRAIEWNDSGDNLSNENELILKCFKFLPPQTMNNEPRLMYQQDAKPLERASLLPPMGWVKLPSGESFALADVVALGATKESFDKDADLEFFYFNINLTHTAVKCIFYDESTDAREQLERFRDQIAIARWGNNCIKVASEA
jgi:hypothetical protein